MISLYKPLRYLTLKQAVLIIIPLLTLVSWLVLLFVIIAQYSHTNVETYIKSQGRLITSFLNANTTTFRFHDYNEIRRNMASLDYGTLKADTVIVDDRNEYVIANLDTSRGLFPLLNEWRGGHDLKEKHEGVAWNYGRTDYFVFQYPIIDAETNQYLGTLFSFVDASVFQGQLAAIKLKLIIYGAIFLLLEIIIIIVVSNRIVAPLERFTKKWLKCSDPHKIKKDLSESNEPYTRDILKLSQAIAGVMARQEIDASVGKLLYQIVHDIRGPLGNITGLLNVNFSQLDEKETALLRGAMDNCIKRMTGMADELLDYARAGNINKKEINISKIIKNILNIYGSSTTEKEIGFEFKGDEDVVIGADESKLNRVLVNLISNATDAIENSGKIQVVLKKTGSEEVAIKITDNGKGISKENLSLIFDATFTFGKKKGTGLGLAYCRNVIESHGGRISVESKEGQGSVFIITLPLL